MEKKPIKRNENIVKLSRDHHASLMFCWKIRQGVKQHIATDRMVKYVEYFLNQHFIPHFREEEEVLFKPLDDAKTQKAIIDHGIIKETVNEILLSGKTNQQKELSTLADLVDDHVRYEERILFPYLEQELSKEQLENIGTQIPGEPLKDTFPDDFWVKSNSL